MGYHIPVLLEESIEFLKVEPNKNFIDATLGTGGHTLEILKRNSPKGKILAIDWNEDSIKLPSKDWENFLEKKRLKKEFYLKKAILPKLKKSFLS